jgi:hypothetical protein
MVSSYNLLDAHLFPKRKMLSDSATLRFVLEASDEVDNVFKRLQDWIKSVRFDSVPSSVGLDEGLLI